MKKRMIAAIALMLALVMALTGCSSTSIRSEKEIQADLVETFAWYSDGGETIKSIEITDRKTDKDNKTDKVWLTCVSRDDAVEYTRSFFLDYYLYDDGWRLNHHELYSEKAAPYADVSETVVRNAVGTLQLNIENDKWSLNDETMQSFKLVDQTTNIADGTAEATFAVELHEGTLSAKGEVTVQLVFQNAWAVSGVKDSPEFEVNHRPGMEPPDLSEAELKAILSEGNKNSSIGTTPVISDEGGSSAMLTPQDMENFTIDKIDARNFGCNTTTSGTFEYSCGITTMSVNYTMGHHYDESNGWSLDYVHTAPEVKSIAFDGTWEGNVQVSWNYRDNVPVLVRATFTIQSQYGGTDPFYNRGIEEITAMVNFTSASGSDNSYSGKFSAKGVMTMEYYYNGYEEFQSGGVSLSLDEWIEKPEDVSRNGFSISGIIDIETGNLIGGNGETLFTKIS